MNTVTRISLGALLVLSLLAFGGCGGTSNVGPNKGNYTVGFSNMDQYIGLTFYFLLRNDDNNQVVATANPSVITTGGFSLSFPSVIDSGVEYSMEFWVDVDGNGYLDRSPDGTPAGVDHSWNYFDTGTASGIANTFDRSDPANDSYDDITPWSNGFAPALGDYKVTAINMDAYNGLNFYFKLFNSDTLAVVDRAGPIVIQNGTAMVEFPDVIVDGQDYSMDIWVDIDGDGVMDRSPNGNPVGVDHTWGRDDTGGPNGITNEFDGSDTDYIDITPWE